MKADVKEKWVAALESGKYPQIRGALRSVVGYCCLGVLCDIVDPSEWVKDHDGFMYHGYSGNLPYEVRGMADLSVCVVDKLVNMNDEERASFPEIARYIRESL